jgi:hypothetical protein
MKYECVTQNVLFGKAVLAAMMSGRNYDVIPILALFYENEL